MSTCIWTLLATEGFKFVSASSYDKILKGCSLFDIMHPDEVERAKTDFSSITSFDKMKGTNTSCRLKDYTKGTFDDIRTPWVEVNIVMYIATEDVVLAFFHHEQDHLACGDCKNYDMTLEDCLLRKLHPLLPVSPQLFHQTPYSFTHRSFQILNNQTKSVLLSWPDRYSDAGAQVNSLHDRHVSPKKSCTRIVLQPSITNAFGEKVETLVVVYGVLSFIFTDTDKSSSWPFEHNLCTTNGASPSLQYQSLQDKKYTHNDGNSKHKHQFTRNMSVKRISAFSRTVKNGYHRDLSYKRHPATMLENLLSPKPEINNYIQSDISGPRKHQCQKCETQSSPEWRKGPNGQKTLCNACGLKYARSIVKKNKINNQQKNQNNYSLQQYERHMSFSTSPPSPHSLSPSSSSICSYNSSESFKQEQLTVSSLYYSSDNTMIFQSEEDYYMEKSYDKHFGYFNYEKKRYH